MIRLDSLQRIHGRGFRLTDHLNLRLGAHPGPLGRLEGRVLGRIRPHSRARQDKVNLCRRHERLAVTPRQRVHGVLVDLRQVVAHGVDDGLLVVLQLRGRLLGVDVEGQLLGPVEEELDASYPRLFRSELKAPFHNRRGAWRRIGRDLYIRELGRDLVGCDAIAARPGLDNLYIIGRSCIYGSNTIGLDVSFGLVSGGARWNSKQ